MKNLCKMNDDITSVIEDCDEKDIEEPLSPDDTLYFTIMCQYYNAPTQECNQLDTCVRKTPRSIFVMNGDV